MTCSWRMTKKEWEHSALEEQLRRVAHGENGRGGVSRRSGSGKQHSIPSGSEDTRQESRNVTVKIVRGQREQTETTNDSDKQAVLTVAQDWCPHPGQGFWAEVVQRPVAVQRAGFREGGRGEDRGIWVGDCELLPQSERL
ncbi:hypothetical protein J4Q44_G00387870 [Coregonus suidteri]|uniref:Uncharacterized protein n=1 Tax=Coregonus suidteri TaxID=861788 RepID=A0AAN8KFP7_9TELE